MKDRAGRLAYVWTALKHVRDDAARVKIRVDGRKWFDGKATCVLLGNVGTITGGIRAFELDGGARSTITRLKARVVPAAITVCVPEPS
jgi:diacylglycerol kinase family enzyme